MSKLSNSFSTGGGGINFEIHVQASFVTLMLTGGYAPCLPCSPIVKIKLQGKIDGWNTDDIVVFTERGGKLLGQIKHSIEITKGSKIFGEVVKDAWKDFNNPNNFTKDKDVIALITYMMNKTDNDIVWLTNHARNHDADTFFRNVETANFSSDNKRGKLKVFRHHLKIAQNDVEINDDDFHDFLKHFYCLSYDLGEDEGIVLSLIQSHISQFNKQIPREIWNSIFTFTSNRNHHACIITRENIPEYLKAYFQKTIVKMPENLKSLPVVVTPEEHKPNWNAHSDDTYFYLSLINIIGNWDENNENDKAIISKLLKIGYCEWEQKAHEILLISNSPLSYNKNGIWQVNKRIELWKELSSRIFKQTLESFKTVAISILKEIDPAFELPKEDRYAANIYGKVFKNSDILRKGIVDGLALIANNSDVCDKCKTGEIEYICSSIINEVFNNADWQLWGSLNNFLPTIAEVAPTEFLNITEKALHSIPCPFDELFAQEGDGGITGQNYLTGLLWALEGLAWDEEYFVRVCVLLGELTNRDPGGSWANRPFNSLVTILLPWYPQTLASFEKHKTAVETLVKDKELSNIAWNLIIKLLPNSHATSSSTHKPIWRKIVQDDFQRTVTNQEYWEQVSYYAKRAVEIADNDVTKLNNLINNFNNLPKLAFDMLIEKLSSQIITELPEEQKLLLWNNITQFTNKHRRYQNAEWALSDELLSRIEQVTPKLAPTDPFNLYQNLFSNNDFDLYDENDSWEEFANKPEVQEKQLSKYEERREKLDRKREDAISVIFQQRDFDGIIAFSENVISPDKVGIALASVQSEIIEQKLLPDFINTENKKYNALMRGFIWRKHYIEGWGWCDNIDKSNWTLKQKTYFLNCLPFVKDTWDRVTYWLNEHEKEYWVNTSICYTEGDDFYIAIEKLIEYGRAHSAITCLGWICQFNKENLKSEICIKALISAISCKESSNAIDSYNALELIKFIQSYPSVSDGDLFQIEWAYLGLLDDYSGAKPKYIENKLANEPDFFCQIIQTIYRSENEDSATEKITEETKNIATNAYNLLHKWKTAPGTNVDGTFNAEHFKKWLERVEILCKESGHLKIALLKAGEVLVYTPPDTDGFFINRAVAEVLNAKNENAETMRRGFRSGIHLSRGVYTIDPTGTPERKLAEQYKQKAEKAEDEKFLQLATLLREVSKGYENESKRTIEEYYDF